MGVIGIRLEDKNALERRTPLVPEDVERLVDKYGLRVIVESSARRIYSGDEFRAAGAEVAEDLGDARVIFAVKEVPIEKLMADRTYMFFAHVIKGQKYNMPLLDAMLEKRVTLIDYERIAGEDGQRLIYFSYEAGQAGMLESLWVLGRRFEWEGFQTPLSDLRRAYEYEDLEDAKACVARVGERLRQGFEIDDATLVVGFTGRGHVSRGAQEIFDLLPHEEIAAEDLADLDERAAGVNDRLFKVCLQKEHLAQPAEPGRSFDEDEYRNHPERFRGGRLVRYLPHVTLLVHGVFWHEAYPRFFTRKEAAAMWKAGAQKLRVIGDVTCDVGGSIEITYKATSPENPSYVYDPISNVFHNGHEGPGIVVMAVDNLPCELPRDASRNFSQALRGFVPAVAAADYDQAFEDLELPPEIRRAVVTHRGKLTPDYAYLSDHLEEAGF